MNDLVNKLSSYNILNFLFPGAIFSLFADSFSAYSWVQSNLVIALFFYYFIGLVISRFGSLIVEPSFKGVGFVQYAEYARFVEASKIDPRIDDLSEVNNMYRTLCSLFLLLALLYILENLSSRFSWIENSLPFIGVIVLFVVFCFSYRKQAKYIVSRIDAADRGDS